VPNRLVFHEREVWYCSIGLNIGDEQDGKNNLLERPVLIVKKFNESLAWVLPATSVQKNGLYYHHIVSNTGSFTFILSQLRIISVKRFTRCIYKVSELRFLVVLEKLIAMIQGKYFLRGIDE
jgi:mRNA-degrading endonuclease toxin of MazEF toxin-antitoxin module